MNTRKKTTKPTTDTYDDSVKICRLVSKHPCLYDRSCPDYMRHMIIQDVWKEIAREANKSVKSCQKRWRNIRANYARSMRNLEANAYYLKRELQFLNKHMMTVVPAVPSRRPRSGVNSSREEHDRNYNNRNNRATVEQSSRSEESEDANAFQEDSEQERAGKRLRLSKESKENVQPSNGAASRALDVDDAFLQSVRPEMQKMDFNQKLNFKRRVYDLIGDIFTTNNSVQTNRRSPPPSAIPMILSGVKKEKP